MRPSCGVKDVYVYEMQNEPAIGQPAPPAH